MKHLRICSDLHLEAFTGLTGVKLAEHFLPVDDRDNESILVLAGDISSDLSQLLAFLSECCRRFPKVYYVAGNHEWYRHDYVRYTAELQRALDPSGGSFTNLEYALNSVSYEELEDLKLRFIFAPLWGDGGPTLADRGRVGHYLNDFRLITMTNQGGTRRFTVDDMITIHRQQKADIERYLKQPFDGRTVVITHHLPSRRLVSPRFLSADGSDGANGGFASNCDNLIIDHAPWLWIHGHTHDSIDMMLEKTRVVCNPAGYRGEWATEHNTFMQVQQEENGKRVLRADPVFIDLESSS